ncbi:MAG: TonB-dependent receptor plug domain-containing protein [Paludibacteraceae bacterium]
MFLHYILSKAFKNGFLSFLCYFFIVSELQAQEPVKGKNTGNKLINLDEVVVTATRTNKTLKNTPVITQVITARQIEERGINDVKELLAQEVPGLSFQEVGFGTSIQLQGLDAKHILFLIDGERISGETGNNIDYSRINLSNIERIEIVKGASSAIYGSQAMGGVINIITKNARQKFDIQLGGRYGQTNQTNFRNNNPESSQYTFRKSVDRPNANGNITLGYSGNRLKTFTALQIKTTDAYQLYNTDSISKYYPALDTTIVERKTTTPFNISGLKDINFSQKINYRFTPKLDMSFKGTFYQMNKYDWVANNKYEQNEDYTLGAYANYRFDSLNTISISTFTDRYNRFDKYELLDGRDKIYSNNLLHSKLIFTSGSFTNQLITAGAEFLSENLTTDMFNSNALDTKRVWTAVMYAQDEWHVNKKLNLVAGLRADYHRQFNLKVTPKLSVLYRLFPFTFRFNYAMGYRSPTLKELYTDWNHLGMFWIYGNEALKPETNQYVSLSGEYVSEWLYGTITGYVNSFRNKIEGIWAADQTEYYYRNLSKAFLSGVDLTAKIKLYENLYFNGALNYLYAAPTDGVKLSAASPVSGNCRLEYKMNVRKNYKATVMLGSSFYGTKSYSVEDELNIGGVGQTVFYDVHVKPYSLWNIALTQQFYKSVRLTLGVDNLLDYSASIINFNTSTTPGRRWFVSIHTDIATLANILK